jgi:NAD(P)-dependent dehydrogenase (short-subunit alcohol dehydrogenase family)
VISDIIGRRKEKLEDAVKAHSSFAHPLGKLIPVQGDVTSKEDLSTIAQQIAKYESHLDLLVNNAGISIGKSAGEKGDESANALAVELWGETVDDWMQVYKTNVVSYFFTTVAFLPLLASSTSRKPGHSASVINISSMSGITNVTQNHIKYNVSKAATNQLNQMLAQELSRPGVKVRVNAIAPGVFPSEMTTGESDERNKSHREAEGFRDEKGVPAGRPGKDEDMAQAVLALAVNQYANGQIFAIDGGFLLKNP